MRQGHILYTLYGHEGASTAVNFSPCGDYFCSAGIDSVVMVWKSNLNEQETELIEDIGNIPTGGIAPSPGLNGGITSNRKPKSQPVAGQQISAAPAGSAVKSSNPAPRYSQLPSKNSVSAKQI